MRKYILIILFILFHSFAQASVFKIMPVGDSITIGTGDFGGINGFGYRDHLQTLLGNGIYTFVGDYADPGSAPSNGGFSNGHQAQSGEQPATTHTNLPSALVDFMTDCTTDCIVLILSGINGSPGGTGQIPSDVGQLIDDVTAANSTTKVFVGNYIDWSENDELLAMVTSRQVTKTNLYFVDINQAFHDADPSYASTLMADEVHPNDSGYQVMAQAWYDAIVDSMIGVKHGEAKNLALCGGVYFR